MPGLLLYSTNVALKHHIQQSFRGDVHYVWCSESFDPTAENRYTAGGMVPPSSSPFAIYRRLKEAVQRNDTHDDKIEAQRGSFMKLAVDWHAAGEITEEQRVDIHYMATTAPLTHWRPLVYVIPRHLVEARLQRVPVSKAAGLGPEFIIPDLRGNEFDILEP